MDKNYGGVIWTNHALQRLRERGIKQGDAWVTFKRPEQHRKGQAKNSWISYRTYGNKKIEVVAKKNEDNEWLILSVWSRQVYGNRKTVNNLSLIRKLFRFLFG